MIFDHFFLEDGGICQDFFYKRYSLFWTVNDNCLLCTCANLFTTLKVSMSDYRSSTIGELCNY